MSVHFELKANYTHVEVNVGGSDKTISINEAGITTANDGLIAELDQSPYLKRAEKSSPAKSDSKEGGK